MEAVNKWKFVGAFLCLPNGCYNDAIAMNGFFSQKRMIVIPRTSVFLKND